MGYAEYIRGLLRPVGIYTFAPGSIGNGEIESIGAALDGCEAAVEESEREVLVPTAKDWGLALREELFAKKPAAPTLELACGNSCLAADQRRWLYDRVYQSRAERLRNPGGGSGDRAERARAGDFSQHGGNSGRV